MTFQPTYSREREERDIPSTPDNSEDLRQANLALYEKRIANGLAIFTGKPLTKAERRSLDSLRACNPHRKTTLPFFGSIPQKFPVSS